MKRFRPLLFYLFSLQALLWAQVPELTPYSKRDSLHTALTKQNATWNWKGELFLAGNSFSNTHWQWHQNHRSNLLNAQKQFRQWKDEHTIKSAFYKRYSSINAGLYTHNWLLEDKLPTKNNNYANHTVVLFADYTPITNVHIKPYAGFQQSKNINLIENGWDIGIAGKAINLKLDNSQSDIAFSSDYDFFDTRQNYKNEVSTQISTYFGSHAQNRLKVGYTQEHKQFYDNTGNNLIDLKRQNRLIQNHLTYALSAHTFLTIETHILSKNVSFFNQRDLFLIENRIGYNYQSENLNLNVAYRTSQENIDNNGTFTDSETGQAALAAFLNWKINPTQNIYTRFWYIKMQYDTPDETNYDDRDEQRFILNLRYTYSLSHLLKLNMDLYGFMFHQIYLHKEKSINNNWNRVLKLAPNLHYSYGSLENRLVTSVSANYTAFDFEEFTVDNRSYLSRRFAVEDSLFIPLIKKTRLGLQAKVELEEKGNFFEKQFAQNLIQSYQSNFYTLLLEYRNWRTINGQIGYNLFKRIEWRYNPKKKRNRIIESQGPFIRLFYQLSHKVRAQAYASIKYLHDSNNNQTTYSKGTLSLTWAF